MATEKSVSERADARLTATRNQIVSLTAVKDVASVNELIIELCEDPRVAEAFKEDPRATLERAGVSKEMANLVLAGREYALTSIVHGGGGVEAAFIVVVVIIIIIINEGAA